LAERPDRELVILARQGDKAAFGCLIERCQALAERAALRMVGVSEAAQDLVQEAMLAAYLSLGKLREEASFRSWLYGIVLNVAKSYLREQKRRARFSVALDDERAGGGLWEAGRDADPQQAADEHELHRLVLLTIDELPRAHREAAQLYYYESLTLHEIAGITGDSPGAIKVRLHRARNHLREKLRPVLAEIRQVEEKKPRRKTMVKANVVDIVQHGDHYIVLLQEEAQGKLLAIWVGEPESTAIALGLLPNRVTRPQTFDFIATMMDALGVELEEARVDVLKNDVFFGTAKARVGNKVIEVDARPSDVLALAVRTNSPIYIAEEVIQQAGKDQAEFEREMGQAEPGEGIRSFLKAFEEKNKTIQTPLTRESGEGTEESSKSDLL
jgi:RNA polymerase sigma factor (sigma-70 family)